MIKITLQLIFVFGCVFIAHGQWREPRLVSLSAEDGLISTPFCVLQDFSGLVYVGCNQGLYLYDGSDFEFFGHDADNENTIELGDIYDMVQSPDSLIWMAQRYGVSQLNPRTKHVDRIRLPKENGIPPEGFRSVHIDGNRMVWFGGDHCRLYQFDRLRDTVTLAYPDSFENFFPGPKHNIYGIVSDARDTNILWLSLSNFEDPLLPHRSHTLIKYDKTAKTFTSQRCGGIGQFQDEKGSIWSIGYADGLIAFNPQTGFCQTHPLPKQPSRPNSIYNAHATTFHNNRLVVSAFEGVFSYDFNQYNPIIYSLDETRFFNIASINSNQLWMTGGNRLHIYSPKHQQIDHYSLSHFGFNSNIVLGKLAYNANDGLIYLSVSHQDGKHRIFRIPEDKQIPAEVITTDFRVQGLATDDQEGLHLFGNGSFYYVDQQKLVQHIGKAYDIGKANISATNLLTSQGWICAYDENEIIWFHRDDREIKSARIDNNKSANSIHRAIEQANCVMGPDEKLYCLSAEILQLDLSTGSMKIIPYPSEFNQHNGPILSLVFNEKGQAWFSSLNALGLFELKNDAFHPIKKYTQLDGVGQNEIRTLVTSQNMLWFYGDFGLKALHFETEEVRSFGRLDGVPALFMDSKNALQLRNGKIAIVSGNGVMTFHPDSLWNSKSPEQLNTIIKEIRIDGKPILSTLDPNYIPSVSLSSSNKVIDIKFQALAFPKDLGSKYSYMLEGYKNEWVDIGTNQFVSFTSLPPGQHTFKVKAATSSIRAPIKQLIISIPTPFFYRWYVWVLVLLLAGLITYLLFQNRLKRIRQDELDKRNREKELADLEMKALRSQMNPHFMFNTLNSIKSYIIKSETRFATEYLSDFADLVRKILQRSRENFITLEDELETLLLYINLEKLRFTKSFSFHCHVDKNVDLSDILIPPMVLQPFIENAIWHGLTGRQVDGQLHLTVREEGDKTLCIIEDNGIGRQATMAKTKKSPKKYDSLGMRITQERIELVNKLSDVELSVHVDDLTNSSGNGCGTRVTITIQNQ